MKKAIELNIAGKLDAETLRILRAVPDLDVTPGPLGSQGTRADGLVRYGDNETQIAIEVKRRVDVATAHHVIHIARQHLSTPLLLVAGETTKAARTVLADEGIAYMDGLGNARIELPGLILRLAGTQTPPPTRSRSTLSGKSGLIAQALLLAGWVWPFTTLGVASQRCATIRRYAILASSAKPPHASQNGCRESRNSDRAAMY